jgi:hypothetical protein
VFGRDPDAILDMVELEADDADRWKHVNGHVCKLCADAAIESGHEDEWFALPDVARTIEANAVANALRVMGEGPEADALKAKVEKVKAGKDALSAWRIDATLREFPRFAPVSVWFDWPMHVVDPELDDLKELGGEDTGGKRKPKAKRPDTRKELPDKEQATAYAEINGAIGKAVRYCEEDGVEPTRKNIQKRIPDVQGKPPTYKQVCNWTDASKTWCEWVPGDYARSSERGEKTITRRDSNEKKPRGSSEKQKASTG